MAAEPCVGVWAPKWLSYFTLAVSAFFMVVAVVGNVLVCLAVIKDPHRKLRTPFMFILVNLAATDLVVGCITLPTSVVTHSLEAAKTKKNFHVLIIHMTYFISCIASVLNLTALCVDRLCAVSWPVKYRYRLSFKVCAAISAFIWMLAVGISMLYWAIGYTNLLFIYAHTALAIAFVISAVTYRVSQKLWNHAKNRCETLIASVREDELLQPFVPTPKALQTKAERNMTRLLLAILTTFIICYSPAIVMMYILKWCTTCDCNFRHVLRDLTFLFIVSSSAINPFVCAIRLKSFRQALKSILFGRNGRSRFPSSAVRRTIPNSSSGRASSCGREPLMSSADATGTGDTVVEDALSGDAVIENANHS